MIKARVRVVAVKTGAGNIAYVAIHRRWLRWHTVWVCRDPIEAFDAIEKAFGKEVKYA